MEKNELIGVKNNLEYHKKNYQKSNYIVYGHIGYWVLFFVYYFVFKFITTSEDKIPDFLKGNIFFTGLFYEIVILTIVFVVLYSKGKISDVRKYQQYLDINNIESELTDVSSLVDVINNLQRGHLDNLDYIYYNSIKDRINNMIFYAKTKRKVYYYFNKKTLTGFDCQRFYIEAMDHAKKNFKKTNTIIICFITNKFIGQKEQVFTTKNNKDLKILFAKVLYELPENKVYFTEYNSPFNYIKNKDVNEGINKIIVGNKGYKYNIIKYLFTR